MARHPVDSNPGLEDMTLSLNNLRSVAQSGIQTADPKIKYLEKLCTFTIIVTSISIKSAIPAHAILSFCSMFRAQVNQNPNPNFKYC